MPDEPYTPTTHHFADDKTLREWLRKPFDPKQIGRLPATGSRPALDFVGHAAVTDRLNKLAPDWTYTVDERWDGLSAEYRKGVEVQVPTFWVRGTMTIGGVSRAEFGDGKDAKEAIGNFIRRGAMRFGVAIDLWSREELESAPPQPGAAAGGRVDQASSASRASSGPGSRAPAAPDSSRDQFDRPGSSSEGTTEVLGEGASDPSGSTSGPGEGSLRGDSPSLGADHPGPPHYPLRPDECDHKSERTGHLLRPRKSPRGPVCPRCGLSYIAVTEGTTADLGAAS